MASNDRCDQIHRGMSGNYIPSTAMELLGQQLRSPPFPRSSFSDNPFPRPPQYSAQAIERLREEVARKIEKDRIKREAELLALEKRYRKPTKEEEAQDIVLGVAILLGLAYVLISEAVAAALQWIGIDAALARTIGYCTIPGLIAAAVVVVICDAIHTAFLWVKARFGA